MTAKEMFRSQGYKLVKNDKRCIAYSCEAAEIDFLLETKVYNAFSLEKEFSYLPCPVEMAELKAINQQCKELGWLE